MLSSALHIEKNPFYNLGEIESIQEKTFLFFYRIIYNNNEKESITELQFN